MSSSCFPYELEHNLGSFQVEFRLKESRFICCKKHKCAEDTCLMFMGHPMEIYACDISKYLYNGRVSGFYCTNYKSQVRNLIANRREFMLKGHDFITTSIDICQIGKNTFVTRALLTIFI